MKLSYDDLVKILEELTITEYYYKESQMYCEHEDAGDRI